MIDLKFRTLHASIDISNLSKRILLITLGYMPDASKDGGISRPEFIFVGGHPAIDFANTLVPPPGLGIDFLPAWPDVTDWLAQAKISTDLTLDLPPARQSRALKSVWELRQDWRQELASLLEGRKVGDHFLSRLNRILARDGFHEVLQRAGKKQFRLVRSTCKLRGGALILALLARQIAVFLAEADLSYLRRCANTSSCVLYFYDTTKNHGRQWCSVGTCGNRHRVAEFRRRQSEESMSSRVK